MNERFLPVRASLLLARRALEQQLALTQAGIPPSVDGLAEVLAGVDDALKALDALEKGGPLRVLPGGRGRRGR